MKKQSLLLLATHHRFQGPQFHNFVEDPSYTILIDNFMRTRQIDFVFEEAGKRGPSIAEDRASLLLGPARYMNVEPQNDLRKFGISEIQTETSHWVDEGDKSAGKYDCQDVDAHKNREEIWLRGIKAQQFERGLVVLGVGHSLSFAFRLQAAGFDVELFTYLPDPKPCT